jgi:hypothetical protein
VPTPVPIDPAKLLEAATQFAEHQTAQGRPRPIWLRRAVSTAYYALYHELCRQAAAHLLPSAPPADQLRLTRSFTHQALRDTCEWIAGRGRAPRHAAALVTTLSITAIQGVATAFLDLQEARHDADYDHLAPFDKATVLQHVRVAERAIATLAGASAQDRQTFFALLALKTQLR